MKCCRILRIIVVVLCLSSSDAMADTLVIGGLTYKDVRVTGVRGDQIVFVASGREILKPIAQVTKIAIEMEPAFNTAEEAFAAKDWAKASDGYERTLRTTQKDWLKDWCSVRLLESANKAGRFDAALKAFVALAEKSPDSAKAVSLNMPHSQSAYLPDGIKAVETALARTRKNESKEVLLRLLVELHKAKGDAAGAKSAAERLVQLMAVMDPNSPAAQRNLVLLKIQTMRAALEKKDYDTVFQIAQKDGDSIIEVADQIEALYCLAEARAGKAATTKDADVWRDVAVAYMRVVAHAGDDSDAPQVAAALLRTAAIHRDFLSDRRTALAVYRQVQAKYKGQEAGKQAEQEIARLEKAG